MVFHPDLFQDFDFQNLQRSQPSRSKEWLIFNASGEDISPHSIGEVVGFCDYDGTGTVGPLYKVVKPTDDSLYNVLVIEQPLAADKIGTGTNSASQNGLIIAYDEEDGNGDPSPGDTLGSQSGSWRGKVGHDGFVIYGVDNSVGVMGKRAFCRPYKPCIVPGCAACTDNCDPATIQIVVSGYSGQCSGPFQNCICATANRAYSCSRWGPYCSWRDIWVYQSSYCTSVVELKCNFLTDQWEFRAVLSHFIGTGVIFTAADEELVACSGGSVSGSFQAQRTGGAPSPLCCDNTILNVTVSTP